MGYATRQFAHQSRDGRRLFAFGPYSEYLDQSVYVHVAGHNVRMFVFANHFNLLVLVPDLADDFLNQIFDGHQARHPTVLVHHHRHANIVLLHIAQQVADQFALGHKVDITAHDRVHSAIVGFGVRDLQDVLREDDAHDVMDGAFEHRHPGETFGAQQFDKLLDGGVGRNSHDLRPRFHRLAYGLLAELHHRLDQVPIAFIQDAFFLPGLDERVYRLRLGLRRFVRMLLGQRRDRLQESQHQGDRQDHVDQNSQEPRAAHQPFSAGPRKENKWQKAVKQNDDEDQAQGSLKNLVDTPGAVAKYSEAHHHGDSSCHDLGQHRHGESSACPAYSQSRLDSLLEVGNVLLEFPGEKSSDLGVHAIRVGNQRQQAE